MTRDSVHAIGHPAERSGKPAKNHREDQHDNQQREQHLHDHGKNPAPVGDRAWRWNCPAPPRRAATWRTGPGRASAAAPAANLQRVPDRSAARRQNLASSGLPNRQCVHCFILSPQYRWSVESIRLLARAPEASVLHAAPVVQPETTSPCLPAPCPVTHRYAATMPRGARPITTRQSTVVPIPLFSGKTQNTQPTTRFDDFYAYESCRESEQPALSAYNR